METEARAQGFPKSLAKRIERFSQLLDVSESYDFKTKLEPPTQKDTRRFGEETQRDEEKEREGERERGSERESAAE